MENYDDTLEESPVKRTNKQSTRTIAYPIRSIKVRRNLMPLKNFKIQPKVNLNSHKLISTTLDQNNTKLNSAKQILERKIPSVEMVEEENDQICSHSALSGTSIIDFLQESESFEQDFISKTPNERSWRDVNNKSVYRFRNPKFILDSNIIHIDFEMGKNDDICDDDSKSYNSSDVGVKAHANFTKIHLFSANRLCSRSASHKIVPSFISYDAEEENIKQVRKRSNEKNHSTDKYRGHTMGDIKDHKSPGSSKNKDKRMFKRKILDKSRIHSPIKSVKSILKKSRRTIRLPGCASVLDPSSPIHNKTSFNLGSVVSPTNKSVRFNRKKKVYYYSSAVKEEKKKARREIILQNFRRERDRRRRSSGRKKTVVQRRRTKSQIDPFR